MSGLKTLPWAALAVLLLAAGCASAQPATVPDIETVDEAPESAAEGAAIPVVEGLPVAPAPADSYRADVPTLIGATGNPQLVEFFAFWCTTCRYMRPTVHELEADYWGKLNFVYLDIDDAANSDTMKEFGFVAQPLFVLVDSEGTEIQRWYGVVDAEEFRTAFDAALEG